MKKCFVIMPFGSGPEYPGAERESRFILEQIVEPAVRQAEEEFRSTFGDTPENEFIVHREPDSSDSGDISHAIIQHIVEADLTIVDLTGRNSNVFFELGIRFALKRNGTILLTQDSSSIPFNVQQFRVVEYDPHFDGINDGIAKLKKAVVGAMRTLSGPLPRTTDSLVFQSLPDLRVAGAGLVEEGPSENGGITWEEYWARVLHVESELIQLRSTGAYLPDLIIGISNGGLFLADTCLRLVYANDLPLISLWAQRSHELYFDNPVNDSMISEKVLRALSVGREVSETKPIKVLVMDDIVGTQRTFQQLMGYLESRLGDFMACIEVRFVFLYTPRSETLKKLQGNRLSADTEVARKYRTVFLEEVTTKSQLPYRKNIHYGDVVASERTEIPAE